MKCDMKKASKRDRRQMMREKERLRTIWNKDGSTAPVQYKRDRETATMKKYETRGDK
jgi:hypothetical protein